MLFTKRTELRSVFPFVFVLFGGVLVMTLTQVEAEGNKNVHLTNLAENSNTYADTHSDFEPTCPFIYDDYRLDMKIAGMDVVIDFSPEKLGISRGYYCAINTEVAGTSYGYRFGNCSCGSVRYCDFDSDSIYLDTLLGTKEFKLGKCQFDTWILVVPSFVGAVLVSLCCCTAIQRRRKRAKVTVIMQECDYIRLPDGTTAPVLRPHEFYT
eukprot:CAMPEP_0204827470 /NCGR_PEP_ID=MMETSP1346-20131115/4923_1 /ASSEMBLY_ACC=CAM_ASM_000771 /TAXON_ID=215587 /ORGANISM="Aplanochytrium stocchinoi, Strain GSBS06" /LENGTH=209 /DNA_ID=CAMNT_0051955913 /DNA_START=243 /DNA_END=872 /DNA_ORIENTATION=-